MKDDRVYLEHIANSFRKLLEYAEGITLDGFLNDSKTQDVRVRQLEIAGEATKRLSLSLRERFTEVPWKDMAGMHDGLIHQYIDVDLMIVWLTITEEATPLLISIEKFSPRLRKNSNNNLQRTNLWKRSASYLN